MGVKTYLENIKKFPKSIALKVKFFFLQEYFRSSIVLWLLALSFFVALANVISLAVFVKPVDFPIILHYNVFFGVDVLESWDKVFIMPLIGVFLFIVNTLLGVYFYRQGERIASYILAIANLMIQLCLLIACASIILINY